MFYVPHVFCYKPFYYLAVYLLTCSLSSLFHSLVTLLSFSLSLNASKATIKINPYTFTLLFNLVERDEYSDKLASLSIEVKELLLLVHQPRTSRSHEIGRVKCEKAAR